MDIQKCLPLFAKVSSEAKGLQGRTAPLIVRSPNGFFGQLSIHEMPLRTISFEFIGLSVGEG